MRYLFVKFFVPTNLKMSAKTVKDLALVVKNLEANFLTELQSLKSATNLTKSPTATTPNDSNELSFRIANLEKYVKKELAKIHLQLEELCNKCEESDKRYDNQVQQSNNYSLLFHGIVENSSNSSSNSSQLHIYDQVLDVLNKSMGLSIQKSDIRSCYRIGKKVNVNNKARPIAVYFTTKWLRDSVFFNKKKLKGKRVTITELLTKPKHELFKKCAAVFKNNCWTSNGRIFVISDNKKTLISSNNDLDAIV